MENSGQGTGVALLTGNGNGTSGFAGPFQAGMNPTHVAVGQFNADEKLDLAVADSGSHTVGILLDVNLALRNAKHQA